MESLESVVFTFSLLLLVISISLSPLVADEKTTTVPTLLCMVLVSVTTFLNTLGERKHSISKVYTKTCILLAVVLMTGVVVAFWLDQLLYIQYIVVVFLIISILVSMTLMRLTKPIQRYQHLEKANKIFALTFLILAPAYLIFHYAFEKEYQQFQVGFLLHMAFIALASSKIYDDLQRLSLLNATIEPQKQKLRNYGLTEREEEIATLLMKGITYQDIAEQLFISLPTVKTHASNIYKKCKVKSRNELTVLLIS